MKLSDMVPLDQEIEQARAANPEFREAWDGSEFARAVAIKVAQYRAKQKMTQAQLAKLTGLTQPQIATLEAGEDAPTLKTLARVSKATGLKFHVDVAEGAATLAAA